MIGAIKTYLLSLCAAALVTSLVMALLPQGGVKRVAGVLCGLLMVLTALSPLAKIDAAALSRAVTQVQLEAEAVRSGVTVRNQELQADIISRTAAAYILDKAASLGFSVTADVSVRTAPSGVYMESVTLTGEANAEQKRLLTAYIEENFAIPEERQTWIPHGKTN